MSWIKYNCCSPDLSQCQCGMKAQLVAPPTVLWSRCFHGIVSFFLCFLSRRWNPIWSRVALDLSLFYSFFCSLVNVLIIIMSAHFAHVNASWILMFNVARFAHLQVHYIIPVGGATTKERTHLFTFSRLITDTRVSCVWRYLQ